MNDGITTIVAFLTDVSIETELQGMGRNLMHTTKQEGSTMESRFVKEALQAYYGRDQEALRGVLDRAEKATKPWYSKERAKRIVELAAKLGITMGHLRDDGGRELETILERLILAEKAAANPGETHIQTAERLANDKT